MIQSRICPKAHDCDLNTCSHHKEHNLNVNCMKPCHRDPGGGGCILSVKKNEPNSIKEENNGVDRR